MWTIRGGFAGTFDMFKRIPSAVDSRKKNLFPQLVEANGFFRRNFPGLSSKMSKKPAHTTGNRAKSQLSHEFILWKKLNSRTRSIVTNNGSVNESTRKWPVFSFIFCKHLLQMSIRLYKNLL